jgi:hypothetical protein
VPDEWEGVEGVVEGSGGEMEKGSGWGDGVSKGGEGMRSWHAARGYSCSYVLPNSTFVP